MDIGWGPFLLLTTLSHPEIAQMIAITPRARMNMQLGRPTLLTTLTYPGIDNVGKQSHMIVHMVMASHHPGP